MRVETVSRKLYKYGELSDKAKSRARDWFREASAGDVWFAENVIYDAVRMAEIMGINIDKRDGEYLVYWSGFYSQGDGACFESNYAYKKGALQAIKAEAPNDETLHAIARELQDIQRAHFYKLKARTTHRGHYYHEYSMSVDVWHVDGNDARIDATLEQTFADVFARFAKWIYRNLEAEWDYTNGDEYVTEAIEANAYEFTEDGAIA